MKTGWRPLTSVQKSVVPESKENKKTQSRWKVAYWLKKKKKKKHCSTFELMFHRHNDPLLHQRDTHQHRNPSEASWIWMCCEVDAHICSAHHYRHHLPLSHLETDDGTVAFLQEHRSSLRSPSTYIGYRLPRGSWLRDLSHHRPPTVWTLVQFNMFTAN